MAAALCDECVGVEHGAYGDSLGSVAVVVVIIIFVFWWCYFDRVGVGVTSYYGLLLVCNLRDTELDSVIIICVFVTQMVHYVHARKSGNAVLGIYRPFRAE